MSQKRVYYLLTHSYILMKAFGNIFYESLTSVSLTVNQMRNNGKCDFFLLKKRLYFQDQNDLKSTYWKSEYEYVKLSKNDVKSRPVQVSRS